MTPGTLSLASEHGTLNQGASFVLQCGQETVSAWMNSSLDPPCWWHLAKALRDMEMGRLADEIERNHGQLIKCSLIPLTLYIIPP